MGRDGLLRVSSGAALPGDGIAFSVLGQCVIELMAVALDIARGGCGIVRIRDHAHLTQAGLQEGKPFFPMISLSAER